MAALSAAVAVGGAALAGPARAASIPVLGTGLVVKDAQPDFAWDPACGTPGGSSTACYVSKAVTFPSRRSGATLAATLYGPPTLSPLVKVPAVVVIPPSGGAATQGSVSYLAKYLSAADGFIALTVDPQGVGNSETFGTSGPYGTPCAPGTSGRTSPDPCPNLPYQQMDNFFDAGQSALDYLERTSDPWLGSVDTTHVGAVGHSEGARAAAYLQDPKFDGRVTAVVALDNLTTNWCGDAGTPSNEGPGGSSGLQNALINGEPDCLLDPSGPSFDVTPTAPALGLASDGPGGLGYNYPAADPAPDQTEGPADEKETAALAWRDAGIPTGELVLAGVSHGQFSQTSTSSEQLLHQIAVYTAAWFDEWLGQVPGALATITACSGVDGPTSNLLSASYLSSVWVGPTAIADLRQTCSSS